MLDDIVRKRTDYQKRRKEGLTFVVDRYHGSNTELFELATPYVDGIKIQGVVPLLSADGVLAKKIKFYHQFNLKVVASSAVSEFAIIENSFERFVKESEKLGFDIIEVGENIIDLSVDKKKKIKQVVEAEGLQIQWKVGKRDPRHQLTIDDTLKKIQDNVSLGAEKIVLEANQGYDVGIFDENGLIKWGPMATLTNKYPPSTFIFEAPQEFQQFALIAEFGERVNMSEIDLESIFSVESERRGIITKSAFGNVNLREDPEGGPATKFIYYIIKTKNPIEQSDLINLSRLPRRTVQNSVDELKNQGLIVEKTSLNDARKRTYYPIRSEWL